MTRRRARLASCALATSVLVTAATGCSLIVGLGADAVPAPVDAAVVDATTVTPFVCPAGTGWQLDCSFGAAPGVVFARQAMGPGSVFSYAASSGLYVSATLDQGGLETVVTSYQVDGSAGNAQVVFEGGRPRCERPGARRAGVRGHDLPADLVRTGAG